MRFKSRVLLGTLVAAVLALLAIVPALAADGQLNLTDGTDTLNVAVFQAASGSAATGQASTVDDNADAVKFFATAGANAKDTKVGNTLYVSNKAQQAAPDTSTAAADVGYSRVFVTLTLGTGVGATTTVDVKNSSTGALLSAATAGKLVVSLATPNADKVYQGIFDVVPTASAGADIPQLSAADSNIVQVTKGALVLTLTVDGTGPAITSTLPANKAIQSATNTTFSATITDAGSGLRPDASPETEGGVGAGADADGVSTEPLSAANGSTQDIKIRTGAGGAAAAGGADNSSLANFGWTAVTSGYSFNMVQGGLAAGDLFWDVRAKDRAGNITWTDADGTTTTTLNAYKLTVDNTAPVINAALTGKAYDAVGKKTSTTPNRSSIKLTFTNGPGGSADFLNSATVPASAFAVAGNTVTGVTFPNHAVDTALAGSEEHRNIVYLALGTALAGDAKPIVTIFGTVRDLAGNTAGAADFAVSGVSSTTDGIAPTFTVTVNGQTTRQIVKGTAGNEAVVRIVSDEPLNAEPTVTFFTIKFDDATALPDGKRTEVSATIILATAAAVAGLTNTWEVKQGNAIGANTLVGAFVRGTDKNAVNGSKGSGGTAAAAPVANNNVALSSAILFEIDATMAAPTAYTLQPFVTGAVTKTESTNPFIRIDFGESTEYGIPNTGGGDPGTLTPQDKFDCGISAGTTTTICVTTAAGTAGPTPTSVEVDTGNAVTLTSILLDGVDVSGQVTSVDPDSFVLAARGLAIGVRTLTLTATDAVGNALATQTFTFTVVARSAYSVALSPGWNLVSVPGTPADNKIDSVLPASHPATQVLTYSSKAAAGPWLAATRGADGKWTGTLTTIDANRAYWVLTTQFAPISTLIPDADPAAVLPTIALSAGWNMLPVVDLRLAKQPANLDTYLDLSTEGGAAPTSGIDPDVYLAGSNWSVAYGFDTQRNQWRKIIPAAAVQDRVGQGRGYWVWVTKDGTLIP